MRSPTRDLASPDSKARYDQSETGASRRMHSNRCIHQYEWVIYEPMPGRFRRSVIVRALASSLFFNAHTMLQAG